MQSENDLEMGARSGSGVAQMSQATTRRKLHANRAMTFNIRDHKEHARNADHALWRVNLLHDAPTVATRKAQATAQHIRATTAARGAALCCSADMTAVVSGLRNGSATGWPRGGPRGCRGGPRRGCEEAAGGPRGAAEEAAGRPPAAAR